MNRHILGKIMSQPSARAMNNVRGMQSVVITYFCISFLPTARDGSDSIRMVYVPSHLYHIMFELLKVSTHATCPIIVMIIVREMVTVMKMVMVILVVMVVVIVMIVVVVIVMVIVIIL